MSRRNFKKGKIDFKAVFRPMETFSAFRYPIYNGVAPDHPRSNPGEYFCF